MDSYQHVNPYIAGSPVTGTEMFFGREDVFSFLQRNLKGLHRDSPVVLYGQRRTGKTSVLYQLHRHLDTSYLCIFIDLHGLNLDGIGNLLAGIANYISRNLQRTRQLAVAVPDRSRFVADPRAAFEGEFLDAVWQALGDDHLVLMLDEVVRLEEEVRAGRLEREIFEYLRYLMQHYPRLNFVFSLGSGLEDLQKEYAFLFSVSLYHRISFLEPAAARELITHPVREHYQLTPDAVQKILQVTSGHPYYTQLVCHCLFDRWTRSAKSMLIVEDVYMILAEAVELGSANLTYVWEDSTPGEQALMAGMAAAMRTTNNPVSVSQVRKAWQDVGVSVPEREVAKAVRSLLGREVITGEQDYAFRVDLQRLWLNKHRRLDWVKEDLEQTLLEWNQSAEAAPTDLPQARSRWPLGGRATILVVVAAVVVAGIVAWQLTGLSSHHSALTPRRSDAPLASVSAKASPSPATSTPQAAATASNTVAIGAGAASQAAASRTAAFLKRYFAAINDRNYREYAKLFEAQALPFDTNEKFLADYSSTTDSSATLVSLSPAAQNSLAATITFDSHQVPSASPTHTACTRWRLTLSLQPHGSTYLIGLPPAGHQPSPRPCP